MTFGVWLTRRFAHPVAPSGALWRTIWESPRPPINSYRQIIRFAGRGPRKSQEVLGALSCCCLVQPSAVVPKRHGPPHSCSRICPGTLQPCLKKRGDWSTNQESFPHRAPCGALRSVTHSLLYPKVLGVKMSALPQPPYPAPRPPPRPPAPRPRARPP